MPTTVETSVQAVGAPEREVFVNRSGDTMTGDLNMQRNRVRNAGVVEIGTSDPASTTGLLFYDTDDFLLRLYDGSSWTSVGGLGLYVPYSGAVSDVDLGSNGLIAGTITVGGTPSPLNTAVYIAKEFSGYGGSVITPFYIVPTLAQNITTFSLNRSRGQVNATFTAGTLNGLEILDAIGSGAVTTQNGILIASLTKGSTNHAINIAGTGVGNDIIFGGDTNLYRSAADTLRTDDAFYVGSGSTSFIGKLTVVDDRGDLGVTTFATRSERVISVASTATQEAASFSAKSANATGTVAQVIGLDNIAQHDGAGALTTGIGFRGAVWLSAAGNITTAYGAQIFFAKTGAGTITNAYGLQINSITEGTNNRAINIAGSGIGNGIYFNNGTTALYSGTSNTLTLGLGAAGVDYVLEFNGETNDGRITYMEDEDRFDFDNDVKVTGRLTEAGTFADIHMHDASAGAQSIATGATYTKLTCWTDNGFSSNCTPDATNDKITITKAGLYRVGCQLSFSSGTNNVEFKAAAFLNGTEQNQTHFERKIGTAGDVGSASFIGTIDVTTVPWDLDVRMAHDNAGAVNVTVEYGQLIVEYLGET